MSRMTPAAVSDVPSRQVAELRVHGGSRGRRSGAGETVFSYRRAEFDDTLCKFRFSGVWERPIIWIDSSKRAGGSMQCRLQSLYAGRVRALLDPGNRL
jgi:hypothetical protein